MITLAAQTIPDARRGWLRRLALPVLLAAVGGLLAPAFPDSAAGASGAIGILSTSAPAVRATSGRRPVELGLRFATTAAGTVAGVRFYKGRGNTGRHVISLWTSGGRLLARTAVTRETSGGWQTALFRSPVTVRAGSYVVSYSAPRGHYALSRGYFTGSRSRGPVHTSRAAGVSTAAGRFPASRSTSGYGVDVVFRPSAPPRATGAAAPVRSLPLPQPPPVVSPGHAPSGGCLPRPSRCGYPDALTTGYAHTGVRLTAYTGPMTITRSGTVIDGRLIHGRLTIDADNVTVRRSKVLVTVSEPQRSAIRVVQGRRGALIADVEVDGGGTGIAIELAGVGGIALRTNVYDSVDYFRGNAGSQVLSSYGHDFRHIPGAHSDGFQSLGAGDLVIRGNTLVLPGGPDVNSLVTIGGEYETPHNVVIADNLLNGGGFTISLPSRATGITVAGNRFGRDYSYGLRRDASAASTWTDDVWDDSGRAAF